MKYFTLNEFQESLTANLHGIDNTVPQIATYQLEWLCQIALDPLRELIGGPIVVTSGYRCPQLNQKVGGSDTSFHLLGQAADIRPLDMDRYADVCAILRQCKEQGEAWKKDPSLPQPPVIFTEAIIYPTWFHIAVAAEGSTQRFKLMRYNGFGQGYRKD